MTDYNSRLNTSNLQKKLDKLAKANPAFFDAALTILRAYHGNEQTLIGAIMIGLMDAHALGIAGQQVPEDKTLKRIRAGLPPEAAEPTRVRRSRAS